MPQNRRPIYIGTDTEDAVCERHGAMNEKTPVVTFDGHVHALKEPVSVRSCPDCCLELARESGGPTASEEDAFEACWRQLVDEGWRNGLERLFTDLGRGAVDDGTIYLHETVDSTAVPTYLREADDWNVRLREN
ncbi:hypothetical protein SAMN05421858_0592 [Haladaptatus litoreus]|uniref:Uncharacterized protein n=1 Tax=Haladaptatus litoreus TaxID=553468 RepID=A0A1N6W3J2_9EURY|nr:hypothetical protein [Haladaptatus litoreus]SIQ84763.1 hypothetical protein SAMN05421858_0592 [Haladaptatus litoreus]